MKNITVFLLLYFSLVGAKPTISTILHSDSAKEVVISFSLPAGDCIYYDTVQLDVDHPAVTLTKWHCSTDLHTIFDPIFKDQKKVLTGNFYISALVEMVTEYQDEAFLFVTYYQKNKKKMNQLLVPLHFPVQPSETEPAPATEIQSKPQLSSTTHSKQPLLTMAYEHALIMLIIIGFFILLSSGINLVQSQHRAVWLHDIKKYLLLSSSGIGIYLLSMWPHMYFMLPIFFYISGFYLLRDHHTYSSAMLVKKMVAVSLLTAAWVLTAIVVCLWYLR